MVAIKIRNMKDNKSPGGDGISTVFNLSLEERTVPLEWKEANIIPLFLKRFEKQVREL